ncbi:MAG TPA: tol-pal system protein YbgF [Rhizomicrobium sp.]
MIQRIAVSVFALSLALAPLPAGAQIFGPSDEEKAHEAGQDSAIQDLQDATHQQDTRLRAVEDKVRGLTESLRQATGTNEELQHQIQVQNDKIDRMQKDFAYRLCTLSAQQLGAGDSMNCAAAGTPSAGVGNNGGQAYVPPNGMQPGAPLPPIDATGGNGGGGFTAPPPSPQPMDDGGVVRGRPPGTLGTLPMGSGPASGAPAQLNGSLGGPPPGGNPAQYDQAMNLMSRAQYAEAQAAFRSYADANPADTDLAPQAIYWVANISFVRQDYAPAARTFAEVIKKYPKSQRAPDAMLKLAQSFMGMGQKTEGCTTLGLIKSKYPNASPQTLSQAASLKKTACSK